MVQFTISICREGACRVRRRSKACHSALTFLLTLSFPTECWVSYDASAMIFRGCSCICLQRICSPTDFAVLSIWPLQQALRSLCGFGRQSWIVPNVTLQLCSSFCYELSVPEAFDLDIVHFRSQLSRDLPNLVVFFSILVTPTAAEQY